MVVTDLVSLKSPDAFPALRSTARQQPFLRCQFPHLDRLVQAAADELMAIGGKGDGVDAVFVAFAAFETFD